MIPITAHLKPGDEIHAFARTMRKLRNEDGTCGISSLPVLEDDGRLVGIVSIHELLKAIHPPYLSLEHLSQFTWDGMLESMARRLMGKRVSDLMTSPEDAVEEDRPLMECVNHMLRRCITTLPVVDGAGRLKGMIYESSIFFAVAEPVFPE
ncbi:MAG TPA: CBS domain-containing protein [Deltaproteobacteria bacterium]|nr:CBS domain-containing protein [Deltaproteobacteria bacterium]